MLCLILINLSVFRSIFSWSVIIASLASKTQWWCCFERPTQFFDGSWNRFEVNKNWFLFRVLSKMGLWTPVDLKNMFSRSAAYWKCQCHHDHHHREQDTVMVALYRLTTSGCTEHWYHRRPTTSSSFFWWYHHWHHHHYGHHRRRHYGRANLLFCFSPFKEIHKDSGENDELRMSISFRISKCHGQFQIFVKLPSSRKHLYF